MSINPALAFGGNGKKQLTQEQKEIALLKKELEDVKGELKHESKGRMLGQCGS